MPTRHTPYHQRFVELGAEMGDRIGFDAAVVFNSTQQEHMATREGVGLYDVYYQGPIDIKGPDAQALLDHVLARDVPRRMATDGQVLYSSVCNESGGMIDDLTAYRLGPEHYWLIATPARAETIERYVTEHARERRAYVTNCISGTAYLSVQGPGSRELLTRSRPRICPRGHLPYFRTVQTSVAEVPALVSRTGYSGELGFELYYSRDYALHMWDALTAAGRRPRARGAPEYAHGEEYPLYGLDVSETTSPLEAGLAWAVDLDAAPFVGRDALARQRDEGTERLLTGIELPDLSHVPAVGGAVSSHDGEALGTLTSTDSGWFLGKALAMGYLPAELPSGSVVTVTSPDGTVVEASTTHRPFYDPEGIHVRS